MVEEVKKQVLELLSNDNSGHGFDHVNRVLKLSLKFADVEKANKEIVSLIALLHDVDDYKLCGIENSKQLTNAKKFMANANVDDKIQNQVLSEIECIGYSKLLNGLRPKTIEGKIVSDSDMCDALGVNGILRVYRYSIKNGKPFFDKKNFPISDITADEYIKRCADTSVCHIFEKILKLKDLMMTKSGQNESEDRHKIIVDVLYNLFKEESVPEWTNYLNDYLNI